MNVIFVLADSLNRHHLPIYGNEWVQTPHITRLAEQGVTFEQHYTGSAACMPARRDIWTGCIEFPWRPWGCREAFDDHVATLAKDKKVATHMCTDHYHYWEVGGTGYHTEFYGCDMIRGHESDYWASDPSYQVDRSTRMMQERAGTGRKYLHNTANFKEEAEFPTPKTLQAACAWLDRNHNHGPFFLTVECFDPHEPFHVPPPYDTLYGPPLENETYWPLYGKSNRYEPEVLKRIEQFYAGKVTMFDTWFGTFLDRLDKYKLWDETLVIFTTDHGHYLGDHGMLGKPKCSPWQTLFNIPLVMHLPGGPKNKRSHALSTAVDLTATITDALNLERTRPAHGKSLLPILRGEQDQVRDVAIMGYFGQDVALTDGHFKLHQAPIPENAPLFKYGLQFNSMRKCSTITEDTEIGYFIPHAQGVPVLKVPEKRDLDRDLIKNRLFDIQSDPNEENDLFDSRPDKVRDMRQKLVTYLQEIKVPEEQFVRLDLTTNEP